MAKLRHRAAALIGALLFLVTSVGFSGLVIWQMYQENKQKQTDKTTQNTQDQNNQSEENKLEGTQLKDFTPVTKVETLQKTDTKTGDGAEVKPGDTVTAHYTGAVAATGIIFQSSLDQGQPVPFTLQEATPGQQGVIKGWVDGVPGMKVGGKRRILIPASQAYAADPPQGSNIPPNADLVFDIEVVKIGQ